MNYQMPGPMEPNQEFREYGQKRRPPWLGIALAVAVVIIVVLSAVVITQTKDDESDTATSATPMTSTTAQSSPQPSSTQPRPTRAGNPSMTCEGFTASVDEASQPGWQAVINGLGLAYAAPPDWTVADCGMRMGWAKPCPEGQCVVREFGAASTVANPACKDQDFAMAGVAQSQNPDIEAALDEETKLVPTIYTQNNQVPNVTYSPIERFDVGGRPAVQTVGTVTDMATDTCFGAGALHSMVVTTVPNVEGSVVFLISLRQGINAQPKPDVINAMVKTLRAPA